MLDSNISFAWGKDVVISGNELGGVLQRDGHSGQGGGLFTQPAICAGALIAHEL